MSNYQFGALEPATQALLQAVIAKAQKSHNPVSGQGESEALNGEWLTLDDEARATVRAVVGVCRRGGERVSYDFRAGDVYAYPHPGGGIAWGVDGQQGNLRRGVQRLLLDRPPTLDSLADLKALVAIWPQGVDYCEAARDPVMAKALLSAANAHWRAAQGWIARSAGAAIAKAPEAGRAFAATIEAARSAMHRAVAVHAVEPTWIPGFDAAAGRMRSG